MGYVNRVFTIGMISRPPVLRWIKENLAITDFAVHVENQYTTKDGRHVGGRRRDGRPLRRR